MRPTLVLPLALALALALPGCSFLGIGGDPSESAAGPTAQLVFEVVGPRDVHVHVVALQHGETRFAQDFDVPANASVTVRSPYFGDAPEDVRVSYTMSEGGRAAVGSATATLDVATCQDPDTPRVVFTVRTGEELTTAGNHVECLRA
jgi:hypothetical protein